jgi:hypothetical protein
MGEKIGASDLLSRTVAKRVAQGAAERLDGMNLKRVRTGYQTGRALAVCAAVLMVAGAGQLLAGDVVGSVGKRLLDPAGGHPRWSPIAVSIDVERVDPSTGDAKAGIWAGDSVRVSSVLAQMPEQTRAILMVQRPGRPLEPIPLDAQPISLDGSTGDSLSGPHRAAALLRSVSEPARVWVELRGGPGTPERWRASSREIVIEAERRPRLRGAEVIVTDPAYLGGRSRSVRLPGRTGLSERDLAMAQGGRVEVMARGSLELSEISLNARRMDTEQELRGMDGRIRWREMEPGERGREVGLRGPDGAGEGVKLKLSVIEDRPPTAEIDWPKREEVIALEGAAVPLRVSATDDYRVDRAWIEQLIVRETPHRAEIEFVDSDADDATELRKRPSIDTGALGAVAGETILVRMFARDHRPDELGGAQESMSRELRIRVVDEEEFRQMLCEEFGEEAGEAFDRRREQQDGGGDGTCESCGGPCDSEGNCEGSCEGDGQGEGSGSGSGSGSGTGTGQGSGDGSGEAPPWDEDRFFDGSEREAPDQDSDAPAPSESGEPGPTGSGGASDDGVRAQNPAPPTEQPATPPLAEAPDARGSAADVAREELSQVQAEAEAGVPERYRDLVRAYYERLAQERAEGDER